MYVSDLETISREDPALIFEQKNSTQESRAEKSNHMHHMQKGQTSFWVSIPQDRHRVLEPQPLLPFETYSGRKHQDHLRDAKRGDLGFVLPGKLIPELSKVVVQAKIGEVYPNLVISRSGYNILYPVETAEKSWAKLWHVKYILIKTTGFEDWLQPQLDQIFVWRIK